MNFHVFWRFFGWFSRGFMRFHETSCFVCVFWRCLMCFNAFFSQEFSWILMKFHVFLRDFSLFLHEISSLLVLFVRFSMICHVFQCFVNIFKNLHVLSRFFLQKFSRNCNFMNFKGFVCFLCFIDVLYKENTGKNLMGA